MIEFLEYVPLSLSLGMYFVDYLIYSEIQHLTVIMIIISCVNFVFPMAAVNRYFFPLQKSDEKS